ncbi:MAG: aminotransferase class IV [Haloferula sp.]
MFNQEGHRARFFDGCDRLDIQRPDWRKVIDNLEKRGGASGEQFLRARVLRTSGEGVLGELKGSNSRTVLSIAPAAAPPDSVRVALASWVRDENSPLAGVKCASYAENLLALQRAGELGMDELLFLNSKGLWSEGTTSNGFLVTDGKLVTPDLGSGCLPGTMRAMVLSWAEEMGVLTEERPIGRQELESAPEIFLTSAIRGVVPVVERDGVKLTVGDVTNSLRDRWRGAVGIPR